MVMEKFQQPDFEIIRFEYEDIMTISNGEMANEGDHFPNEDDDFGNFGTP